MRACRLIVACALAGLAVAAAVSSNAREGPETHTVEAVLVPIAAPKEPLSALVIQLASPNQLERTAAAWALVGAAHPPTDVVEALERALSDEAGAVRSAATWALANIGTPEAQRALEGAMDTPPHLIKQTTPLYRPAAYRRKIQGTVDVQILIDTDGKVAHVEVRKSIPGLDESTLECVRQWKFRPALKQGKPVPSSAPASVSYKIY